MTDFADMVAAWAAGSGRREVAKLAAKSTALERSAFDLRDRNRAASSLLFEQRATGRRSGIRKREPDGAT